MSWIFSSRSLSSRRILQLVFAGAFSFVAASCLGVLELDSYDGAADRLCSLYDRCYGPEAFPGCSRYVSGQLEAADADTREDFLETFADCLDDCQHAIDCLNQPLFCHSLRESCSTNAECCGYATNTARCIDQSCCFVNDAPCTNKADCCGGTCTNGKCKGGVDPVCALLGETCSANTDCCTGVCTGGLCTNPCVAIGASCTNNTDCCSGLCTNGACANPCVATGASCTNNVDCCSGICVGNLCTNACADRGAACTVNSDCCSGKCSNGICRKLGCLDVGDLCLSDADCCQDSCDKGRGICGSLGCYVEGLPCSQDGDCCTGLVCNPIDQRCATLTCKKYGDSCAADGECCGLYCNGSCQCAQVGTACSQAEPYKCCTGVCENGACVDCRAVAVACTDNAQCCSGTCNNGACCNTGCSHNLCVVGAPLSTKDCSPKNVGAGAAACVETICAQDPACCCNQWDQSCVDKVASVCKLVCP